MMNFGRAMVTKSRGSLIVGQLSHAGPNTPGYCGNLSNDGPSELAVAPLPPGSLRDKNGGEQPGQTREMTVPEIDVLVEKWAFAAKVLADCGWDGVQVHGSHGYLVSSFLSPFRNRRTDEYGGSVENRARLLFRGEFWIPIMNVAF